MRALRNFSILFAVPILFLAGSCWGQTPAPLSSRPTRLGYVPSPAGPNPPPSQQRGLAPALPNNYGKLPLSFELNQGQAPSDVKFLAHGPGYVMFLTADESVLFLRDKGGMNLLSTLLPDDGSKSTTSAEKPAVLRMKLRGANREANVTGDEALPGKVDYFIGNDPLKWRTNISTYGKVKVQGIYPGVDLVYYGNQRQLEYDFIVAPGAKPENIRLDVSGARNMRIDEKGDLLLRTSEGEIRLQKPVMYQYKWAVDDDDPPFEREAAKKHVDGHFKIRGKNEILFVAGDYDRSKALTIDPPLVYSTFLGGSANDVGIGIAVDSSGNSYVTGGTLSTDFPTTPGAGAWQSGFGGAESNCSATTNLACGDAFVTEINASGTALVFSAYLGGSDADVGTGIAVDSSGNVFVVGGTVSSNFPTAAPLQGFGGGTCGNHPCSDAFVTEIAAGGASLVFSTFLGGNGTDVAFGLALDSNDNVFVTGSTRSTNFPTTSNAVSTVLDNVNGATVDSCTGGTGAPSPCSDAFVAELTFSGGALSETYGTYLGGAGVDIGYSIGLDPSDNIYVVGTTNSPAFPGVSSSPFQSTFGGGSTGNCVSSFICGDGFAIVLSPLTGDGNTPILLSTYIGGSGDDAATAVAVDAFGDLFVAGVTDSTNFPVTGNAFQSSFGGGSSSCANRLFTCGDAFVEIIFSDGGGTYNIYTASYLGGSGDDGVFKGAAIDLDGDFYVAGTTNSTNFPTTANATQATIGGGSASCDASNVPCGDGFVTEIILNQLTFGFSTYLGGSGDDGVLGLTLDSNLNIYVTGYTASSNFPTTTGAFKTTCGTDGKCNGLSDAFVTKFGIPIFTGPYQLGEVFVSGANGLVYVFKPDGTLLGALSTGQPTSTGMAFDQSGNLYVTTFTGLFSTPPVGAVEFDQNAKLKGPFGNFPASVDQTALPESILFNQAGDAFVGAATPNNVCPGAASGPVPAFEFGPTGSLLNTFTVTGQCRGTDWVELLTDQKTLLYTSEGTSVFSFNTTANTQNPDFADELPGRSAYAFRGLANGNLLVADTSAVVQLNSSGQQIQTYTPSSPVGVLFALNLDPDGTSFWTADLLTGNVFKFDIASGNQLAFFTSPSGEAGGLAVFGEKTVGNNNLTVTVNGTGTGTVTSSPTGINCTTPSTCLAPFPDNSNVTLTATAATGSTFTSFSTNCTPANPQTTPPKCTVPIGTADVTVTATFTAAAAFTFEVNLLGSAFGTVTDNSTPQQIDCTNAGGQGTIGSTCDTTYPSGKTVTFTETPSPGSVFAGWGGSAVTTQCPVTSTTCTVTVNQNPDQIIATFNNGPGTFTLTLAVPTGAAAAQATGNGSVGSGVTGGGISCFFTGTNPPTPNPLGGLCSNPAEKSGAIVELIPEPNDNSTFGGWSGTCPNQVGNNCFVAMSQNQTIRPVFTLQSVTLTVTVNGVGSVVDNSTPVKLNCVNASATTPLVCSANYNSGTTITLTATPGTGYSLTSFSACTPSTTASCSITLNAASNTMVNVAATFQINSYLLDVSTTGGNGTGTVTSNANNLGGTINCGPNNQPPSGCGLEETFGWSVTLTAKPTGTESFAGWSASSVPGFVLPCPGTSTTCTFTMPVAPAGLAVTATFTTVQQFQLSVTDAGTGAGTVTGNGINCTSGSGSCTVILAAGTAVTLTEAPATGSTFAGWSATPTLCTVAGTTCTFSMPGSPEAVTATFNKNVTNFTLTVNEAGTGTGTVTSTPAGINCTTPSTCMAPFPGNSNVTLAAAAASGSTFAGWSGGVECPGTGTCTVTMSAAETVTATFNKTVTNFTLTVNEAGTGTGTVTSTPTGINCTTPSTCMAPFPGNSNVTLTAVAASGSTFAGWSGGAECPGTGTCTVAVSGPEAVTATFNISSPVTIGVAPGGSSTATTTPGGSAVFGLTLTSLPGTTGTVTLGCAVINSPNSADIKCKIVPSSIVLTGKAINVAIVVETFCKGAVPGFGPFPGGFAGGLGLLLASMSLCGAMWTFKRRPRWALSFGVLVLIAVGMSACSNLATSPGGQATPVGSYSLVVTATAPNGATSSVPLTLVVGP
jgi:hypothetical protein